MDNDIKQTAPDIAQTIYNILSNFVIDLESYWVISKHIRSLDKNDISRPLWVVLSNNCLQMAVVEWCKVFGSERNNRTHYTKCIDPLDGIDEIVNDMKEFRDKYISHNDNYDKPIPFMNKAIRVMKRFDSCMIEKYKTDNPISTSDYVMKIRKDIQNRLNMIIRIT